MSWDSSLEEGGRFLVLPRGDQLESTKCASRLLKKLCLSLLISKNLKLKKVIKRFVPEPKKKIIKCFAYFGIPYVYFPYSYLGRIFGRGYATHSDNFVPSDHPDRQKKFRMDCVIPCLWIFQTQRGHRQDWQTNYPKMWYYNITLRTKIDTHTHTHTHTHAHTHIYIYICMCVCDESIESIEKSKSQSDFNEIYTWCLQ